MEIILSKDHLAHFPKGEIYDGQLVRPFECPERWDHIVNSLNKNGFQISIQEIKTVQFTKEGFLDISKFDDFIQGTLPGVPLDKASNSLQAGVHQAFEELNLQYVLRNWLGVVAVRR